VQCSVATAKKTLIQQQQQLKPARIHQGPLIWTALRLPRPLLSSPRPALCFKILALPELIKCAPLHRLAGSKQRGSQVNPTGIPSLRSQVMQSYTDTLLAVRHHNNCQPC
jgi:hypothetical protein